MKGYFNRPEVNYTANKTSRNDSSIFPVQTTAQVIRNGWYFTGDKGYYDEEGNLFVVGRYKEIIKYRTVPVSVSITCSLYTFVFILSVLGNTSKHWKAHNDASGSDRSSGGGTAARHWRRTPFGLRCCQEKRARSTASHWRGAYLIHRRYEKINKTKR